MLLINTYAQDFLIQALPRDVQKNVIMHLPYKTLNLCQLWSIFYCVDKKYAQTQNERAQINKLLWNYSTTMAEKIQQDPAQLTKSIWTAFIILKKLSPEFKKLLSTIMARTWYLEENLIAGLQAYYINNNEFRNCLQQKQPVKLTGNYAEINVTTLDHLFSLLAIGKSEQELNKTMLSPHLPLFLSDDHIVNRLPKKILEIDSLMVIWSKKIEELTCEDVLFASASINQLDFEKKNFKFIDAFTKAFYHNIHTLSPALKVTKSVMEQALFKLRANAHLKPLKKNNNLTCSIQ